ncbi:MAG: acyl-protein synthetase [Lachnospiraceae bacterium]|nr:acyl-protein synthetase [Lachnospiraceae bacterium]
MTAREKLINLEDVYDQENSSEIFLEAMRDCVKHHMDNNEFFKKYMDEAGVKPEDIKSEDDLVKIPPIHANFFKKYEILSVPREQIVEHATSSGTTGQKSQMFFDQDSFDFGNAMVRNEFRHFGFLSDDPTNYLLFTYEPAQISKDLGTAKTDVGLLSYAPVNQTFFALRYNGEGHDFDVYGTIKALEEYEEQGLPVRIFGFPSFLYFTVRQMKETGHRPLKLNKKSMTMLGGGWKGYADKQIRKSELYAMVEEMLGIPAENCRDGYGSTEHSVPYFECPNHHFHIPVFSRMFIRDVKTLEPLPYGQPGFANFITPHLMSVPAVSVLMGDMAVLHDPKECGCGIKTPFMEIIGRAGTSKGKSCAITASELLKR